MIYKEYNKNVDEENIKFYEYEFDGLFELVNFINENESYPQWGHNLASEQGDYDFTGTKNIEEAKILCLKANSTEIDKFIVSNNEFEKLFSIKSQKRNFVEDVYGSRLLVSKALTGNPRSMQRLIRNEPLKCINVWVNCSCCGHASTQAIMNRGIIVLNLVKLLEKNGYKVNINFFELSRERDEVFYAKVNIKRPGEKLDLSSTYFPMCHPSFLRRIIFALQERTNCSGNWSRGYGCAINNMKSYIKIGTDDIVIGQPDSVNVYGRDLLEDAISLFNNINFCNYVAPGKKVEYDEIYQKIVFVDDEEKDYLKKL